MPDLVSLGDSVQHVVVTLVALGAAAVVLRKVLGVFGARQAGAAPAPGGAHAAGPACSHCASGNAATDKRPPTS